MLIARLLRCVVTWPRQHSTNHVQNKRTRPDAAEKESGHPSLASLFDANDEEHRHLRCRAAPVSTRPSRRINGQLRRTCLPERLINRPCLGRIGRARDNTTRWQSGAERGMEGLEGQD